MKRWTEYNSKMVLMWKYDIPQDVRTKNSKHLVYVRCCPQAKQKFLVYV